MFINFYFKKKLFKNHFNLNTNTLLFLYFISIIFKLGLIKFGYYGVINTINDTLINIPFITIIIFISNLSTIIFFLFALSYYKYKNNIII
jgi:hypothetical protein